MHLNNIYLSEHITSGKPKYIEKGFAILYLNDANLDLSNNIEIVGFTDYYPFGMQMPGRSFSPDKYRFGFQGQEMDNEISGSTGSHLAFKYRIHDARIGRFFSIDPLSAKYPYNSPYAFSENRVVDGIEFEGLEFWDAGLQSYGRYEMYMKNGATHDEAYSLVQKEHYASAVGGLIGLDIMLNRGKITINTAKDVLYQTFTKSVLNGGQVEKAFKEVDFANAITKGVFAGVGIKGKSLNSFKGVKVLEEAIKSEFDLTIEEGYDTKDFDAFSEELFYRLSLNKLSKSLGGAEKLGKPLEDVMKKAFRAVLVDMNLFGIQEVEGSGTGSDDLLLDESFEYPIFQIESDNTRVDGY